MLDPALLDAGNLSASRPGNDPFPVPRSGGVYRIELPAGSVGQGTYRVSADGGADVAQFNSSLDIPAPIQITTPIVAGMFKGVAIEIDWTGGASNSVVTATVSFRQSAAPATVYESSSTALASQGKLFLFGCAGNTCAFPAADSVELLISMDPQDALVAAVSGLTRGLQHAWRYEFHFPGLEAPNN
jgi:hypothetical protein